MGESLLILKFIWIAGFSSSFWVNELSFLGEKFESSKIGFFGRKFLLLLGNCLRFKVFSSKLFSAVSFFESFLELSDFSFWSWELWSCSDSEFLSQLNFSIKSLSVRFYRRTFF